LLNINIIIKNEKNFSYYKSVINNNDSSSIKHKDCK